MADLTETEEYTAGIYRFEETDPVQGGPGGIDNLPTNQLANRTKWLKAKVDALLTAVSEIDLDLYAPLDSPIFTNNPRGPTPAQFDNDTSFATTEFVRRQGMQFSGHASLTANTALTAAHIGALINLNDIASYTVTMPPTAGLPDGVTICFYSNGYANVKTIAASAGNQITTWGNSSGPLTVQPGTGDLLFVKVGNEWRLIGGSLSLRYMTDFSRSLTASGFQEYPGGLIEQWGTATSSAVGPVTVTFPIAFESNVFSLNVNPITNDARYANPDNTELTTFPLNAYSYTGARVAINCRWRAIGR